MSAAVIFAVVIYFGMVGALSGALGYTGFTFDSLTSIQLPEGLGILTPFLWIGGAIGNYMTLLTFQTSSEVPIWITSFVYLPVILLVGWVLIKLIRGSEG